MTLTQNERAAVMAWLTFYDNREKKPKPWTKDEWLQDWSEAIWAREFRKLLNSPE